MKMMKKLLVVAAAALVAVSSASAAKPKEFTGKPVVIDYDGRMMGNDFPSWVKDFNTKKKVAKALEATDDKIWTMRAQGPNLDFIQTWADTVDIQAQVAQSFSVEMQSTVDAVKKGNENAGNQEVQKTLDQVVKAVSLVRVNGLEKLAQFWIKQGTLKPGVKKAKKVDDFNVEYVYYTVWGMNKKMFDNQIADAAKTAIRENTSLDSGIMKGLYSDVMKKFASGDFESEAALAVDKDPKKTTIADASNEPDDWDVVEF